MADLAGYISNVELFYDTSGVVGTMIVGVNTDIASGATNSIGLGLDGATHVMTDSNTLQVYGNLKVSGVATIGSTVVGDLSDMLDALGT